MDKRSQAPSPGIGVLVGSSRILSVAHATVGTQLEALLKPVTPIELDARASQILGLPG